MPISTVQSKTLDLFLKGSSNVKTIQASKGTYQLLNGMTQTVSVV
jgi:hypothetical protein